MKGHKEHHHKHRETGGFNAAEKDEETRPEARTDAKKIDAEAEEKRRGGRAKRAHGGEAKHHKECKCHRCMGGRAGRKHGGMAEHEKKHVGEVHGEHAKHHAGRKPRKSGGRASSTENPFSSARHGEPAPGRKLQMEYE